MRKRRPRKGGLERAIAATKTITALAEGLKTSIQAVSQWDEIPAERCLEVHRLTGVPLHELRPDIYPSPLDRERMRA